MAIVYLLAKKFGFYLTQAYLRARYYDPELGRFLTEDPAQDGLNWYVYCGNNPVNFVDPSGESFLANWNELKAGISKYGADATNKSKILADSAKNMALKYADDVGYYKTIREFWGPTYGYHHRKEYDTWDNPVDAMRHMEWNSMMTREIGLNQAKFYADNHEYFNLNENKWIISGNGNDNIIYTKMNQPTLMDLWNNKVGRTLASDSNLANLNYNQLFDYAVDHNLLILDANTTYEFYGVLNYVNPVDWTVTVEWNRVNDNLTFKKEGLPNLTLKVGI